MNATSDSDAPAVTTDRTAPDWGIKSGIGDGWPSTALHPLIRTAARMREVGAVQFGGPFKLASGALSDHYFDVKRLLLDPSSLSDLSYLIANHLADHQPLVTAVGGPELGAVPLVGGVLVSRHVHFATRQALAGFIVRKSTKQHGTGKLIEGDVMPGARVALVEDVTTTAESVARAIDAVDAAGARVEVVYVVVNRGGDMARRVIEARGAQFVPVFTSEAILNFCRPVGRSADGIATTERAG